jgi:hypothetical protein
LDAASWIKKEKRKYIYIYTLHVRINKRRRFDLLVVYFTLLWATISLIKKTNKSQREKKESEREVWTAASWIKKEKRKKK